MKIISLTGISGSKIKRFHLTGSIKVVGHHPVRTNICVKTSCSLAWIKCLVYGGCSSKIRASRHLTRQDWSNPFLTTQLWVIMSMIRQSMETDLRYILHRTPTHSLLWVVFNYLGHNLTMRALKTQLQQTIRTSRSLAFITACVHAQVTANLVATLLAQVIILSSFWAQINPFLKSTQWIKKSL